MATTTYAVGVYKASLGHFKLSSKYERGDNMSRAVVYCAGDGANTWRLADSTFSGYWPNLSRLFYALANAGFLIICPELGAATWGNDSALGNIDSAWSFLTATLKSKTDKAILVGHSMGGMNALNWTKRNRALVAGVVGLQAAVDGQWMYDHGFSVAMDAAYSPSNWATVKPQRDPSVFAGADLAGLPYRGYYATDDATVDASVSTAFPPLIGSTASATSIGTGGHTDTPVANLDVKDLASWMRSLS